MDHQLNEIIHGDDEMLKTCIKNGQTKEDYFRSGENTVNKIVSLASPYMSKNVIGKKVLDYGCAHGRISRHITPILKPENFVVADVWDKAVEFTAKNFDAEPFIVSDNNPISELGKKFDIIISISVFSHLPPKKFESNLQSLTKSLAPNGLLMFTTKGEHVMKFRNLQLKDGCYFGAPGKIDNHTNNRLPVEEYSLMCVTRDYVESILNKVGLKIIEHREKEFGRQDLYIVSHQNSEIKTE